MEASLKIVLITVLACGAIRRTDCLTCLSCRGVPSARDCHKVVQCGSQEECYAEQVATESGSSVRNFGCRDRLQCAATYKKLKCSQCCHYDLCQADMCGDTKFQGPICLNCDHQQSIGSCDIIKECRKNDVCHTTVTNGTLRVGCMNAQACAFWEHPIIGRRSVFNQLSGYCFECCHSKLCNDGNCSWH